MFINESYIHFQDDIYHYDDNADDFVDISLRPFRRHPNTNTENQKRSPNKYLSKSADLLYKTKKLNTNRGYDGDSDSDNPSHTPTETSSALARCEICQLDFMHDILDSKDHKIFGVRKRKSKRKRKLSTNYHQKLGNGIDFEDYKDSNEKMEVFAPDSERKWTLQYQYKGENDYPSLAKVIIGRGQNDDYPELNNIHLIQELKDYAQTDWRNTFLENLKSRNRVLKDSFSLLPVVSTCLFCFNERNYEIRTNVRNNVCHAFNLPFCLLDDCLTNVHNDDKKDTKNVEPPNYDNITIYNSPIHRHNSSDNSQPRFEKTKPRNGVVDCMMNPTGKNKRKVVRTSGFSSIFTPKVVDIELSNEFKDLCSVKPNTVDEQTNINTSTPKNNRESTTNKLDDTVNVIMLYTDDTSAPKTRQNEDVTRTRTNIENNERRTRSNTEKPKARPSSYTENAEPRVRSNTESTTAIEPRNGIIKVNISNYNENVNEKLDKDSRNSSEVPSKINTTIDDGKKPTTPIKERRRHKRSLSEKIFRRKVSVEKPSAASLTNYDEDEEFVIIM